MRARKPTSAVAADHAASDAASRGVDRRRDRLLGALIVLAAIVAYGATACPTLYTEDAAEFSTVAALWGVPHPPGYPLYTMIAGLFVRVCPWGGPAFASNLFSAVCGAGTLGVLWALLRSRAVGRWASLAAVVAFGCGRTFWSQGLAAEVYTFDTLLLASALTFSLASLETPSRTALVLAGSLTGAALGHRTVNMLYLAPLVGTVALHLRSERRRLGLYLLAVAGTALVPYAYLPAAASRHPWINMGDPREPERLVQLLTATPYTRHLASSSWATSFGRLGAFIGHLPANLGLLAVACFVGLKRFGALARLPARFALCWLALAAFVFATVYNVMDGEVYFLPTYLVMAIVGAIALDRWRDKRLFPAVLALGLLQLPLALAHVSLRPITVARAYADDLLASAPPGSLVITFGDTETHVLAYEQGVEARRRDVVVVSGDEIAPWYVAELARRHPGVPWPEASREGRWLPELIARTAPTRRVCLTKPLRFLIPPSVSALRARGLLYCLGTGAEKADDQAYGRDFWSRVRGPSPAELDHDDVHVQMVDFSYALARFSFAAELARAGEDQAAREQLRALTNARPDVTEARIRGAMRAIGRPSSEGLGLGERARQALAASPGSPLPEDLLAVW